MCSLDERILVVAPLGRDAANAAEVLREERIEVVLCVDMQELCAMAGEGAGALVITQESLTRSSGECLFALLRRQPAWSDLPIILLTSGGEATATGHVVLRELTDSSAVTVLERPLRKLMFISAARAAMRARRKQIQVRDLLQQRGAMLEELQSRAEKLEASQSEVIKAKETISQHAEALENTVRERTARLQDTIAQLEAFSYSVSHDMRGPLRAMRQYSQILLEEENGLTTEGREFLTRISRAASRLDRLIQDVLLYSRAARADVHLSMVDLDTLLSEIIEQYPGFQPPRAQIEVQRPLAPVLAHEASLTQCISNLLSNAVKFMPPGRTPMVSVGTVANGKTVRIWIQDNGIGIAAPDKERIFNIFERVHAPSEYEGTGIGLAIVKKTIERMGGDVGLESELGTGTRFWIELPKPQIPHETHNFAH